MSDFDERSGAATRTQPARSLQPPALTGVNGLRWLVRTGAEWRFLPHDLPPWGVVYQQTQRWLKAGVLEAIVADLRARLRLAAGRQPQPSAAIFDSRTLQSSPESGARAGYDGAKRKKGSQVPAAVDTLGQRLALHVTPAHEQDRAQVGQLAQQVQTATGETVEVALVDPGDTGDQPAQAAEAHGIRLEVVKLPDVKKGFGPAQRAAPLGGGAQFRLDRSLPPPGA